MLSRLFFRHKKPQPQFAPGLFLALIIIFAALAQIKPSVGLTGLGATAILGAAIIELNRVRIWETYRKAYKKRKGITRMWHEPNKTYYTINVMILWPFVAFLGFVCIWTGYLLG